ncbi:MAG: PepSY-associated TM helix domain-containing protein, partial [Pseudomonas caspiana]
MKGKFRQSMSWLHTWCGLLCGWLLCAIFLTGTLSVFREPITRWMEA